jgi:hypothetical protein
MSLVFHTSSANLTHSPLVSPFVNMYCIFFSLFPSFSNFVSVSHHLYLPLSKKRCYKSISNFFNPTLNFFKVPRVLKYKHFPKRRIVDILVWDNIFSPGGNNLHKLLLRPDWTSFSGNSQMCWENVGQNFFGPQALAGLGQRFLFFQNLKDHGLGERMRLEWIRYRSVF